MARNPREVEALLRYHRQARIARHVAIADVWSSAAEAAPAMGMVGTLIGLASMFASMTDPKAIGGAMAIALLATLYGALLANLVLTPIATACAPPAASRRSSARGSRRRCSRSPLRETPRHPLQQRRMTGDSFYPPSPPTKPLWLMTLADLALLLVGFFVLVQASEQRPRAIADGVCARASARPRRPPPRCR